MSIYPDAFARFAKDLREALPEEKKTIPLFTLDMISRTDMSVEEGKEAGKIAELMKKLSRWKEILCDRIDWKKAGWFGSFKDGAIYRDYDHVLCISRNIARRWLPNRHFLVLRDLSHRIQGFAIVSEKTNSLVVDTMATAAWNISLENDLGSCLEPFVVCGVGRTLMRQIYELARAKKKKWIKLDTMPTSLGFYQKLGMEQIQRQSPGCFGESYTQFRMQVQVMDSVPKSLVIPSGNLTSATIKN